MATDSDKIKQLPDGEPATMKEAVEILYDELTREQFVDEMTERIEIADKENTRLVSELETAKRALEHYANPENWCQQVSEVDGCPLDDFDVMLGNGNGYNIAQAALKSE